MSRVLPLLKTQPSVERAQLVRRIWVALLLRGPLDEWLEDAVERALLALSRPRDPIDALEVAGVEEESQLVVTNVLFALEHGRRNPSG